MVESSPHTRHIVENAAVDDAAVAAVATKQAIPPRSVFASAGDSPARSLTTKQLADAIGAMIQQCDHPRATGCECVDGFTLRTLPSMPFAAFVDRVAAYSGAEATTLEVAAVYLHRVLRGSRHDHSDSTGIPTPCPAANTVMLTRFSAYRLFAASVLVAIKLHQDAYFALPFYARVFGIAREDLRMLERNLLLILDHDLYVSSQHVQLIRALALPPKFASVHGLAHSAPTG